MLNILVVIALIISGIGIGLACYVFYKIYMTASHYEC